MIDGEKMKEQKKKKASKTIDIVSYALKVSVNGVICVFVAHFRSSGTLESSSTGLTVNIHVSTKTCATGNNFILHKALVRVHVNVFVQVCVRTCVVCVCVHVCVCGFVVFMCV